MTERDKQYFKYIKMDFKAELSQNSIQELRNIIQESVRKEIKNLFPEFREKSNEEQFLICEKLFISCAHYC